MCRVEFSSSLQPAAWWASLPTSEDQEKACELNGSYLVSPSRSSSHSVGHAICTVIPRLAHEHPAPGQKAPMIAGLLNMKGLQPTAFKWHVFCNGQQLKAEHEYAVQGEGPRQTPGNVKHQDALGMYISAFSTLSGAQSFCEHAML